MREPTKEEVAEIDEIVTRRLEVQHEEKGAVLKLKRICGAPASAKLDMENGRWVQADGKTPFIQLKAVTPIHPALKRKRKAK